MNSDFCKISATATSARLGCFVRVFLPENDVYLQFSKIDAIRAMGVVASGALDESQLANWFWQRLIQP